MDFKHPYLTQQIIAYIGNKRRLLPLIHRAMQQIYGEPIPQGLQFADPFAGSGIVSRLAKVLGFQVTSNDWEPYAFTLGKAYLEINASDIEPLFGSFQELENLLHYLNTLPDPPLEEQYIARYYAPATADPAQADYRKERLFYTRENALRIDRIRNEIDRVFPLSKENVNLWEEEKRSRCRTLLIALLLYEAATHTNTSGVFKAYHRGFGGHGKDALGRILRPIQLETPPLIDSPYPCRMYGVDATTLFRSLGRSFDLVYLDPPYNQHQYGSNYHLLNTIVLWDKVTVPLELGPDGWLRDKAGIRKDWKRTKSAYCYRETAVDAFAELLNAIDAEHLLISYSTDGIIPFGTLRELCSTHGEVSILTNEYITYRGGKQSNLRRDRNVEFVLWVWKGGKSKGVPLHSMRMVEPIPALAKSDMRELDRVLVFHRLQLLLRRVYRREALRAAYRVQPEGEKPNLYRVQIPLKTTSLFVSFRYLVEPECPMELYRLSMEDLFLLEERLQSAVCITRKDELDTLLSVFPDTVGRDRSRYQKKILNVLRKLAHRKYQALFWESWEKVEQLFSFRPYIHASKAHIDGQFRWKEELNRIRTIAELRFSDRQRVGNE
ncbi:MAG: DNA adenine methylase [Spirochaetes bacterium]|nr:DNA adenine methylase [Spirochaetota bacterium]